jgi:FkbM family methyltransferase
LLQSDLSSKDAEELYKAQHGEDKQLAKHFDRKKDGFYVEVGAFDGVEFSNTYYFEQIGWTGVLIEADPVVADKCRKNRTGSQVVNCAAVAPGTEAEVELDVVEGAEYFSSRCFKPEVFYKENLPPVHKILVPARTLDAMLEQCNVTRIDFLTIDVEGFEYDVLQGFTIAKYSPEIVIVERFHQGLFPDWKIVKYMHRNGYYYGRITGCNDWFIRAAANNWVTGETLRQLLYPFLSHAYAEVRWHTVSLLRRMGLLKIVKVLLGRTKNDSDVQ